MAEETKNSPGKFRKPTKRFAEAAPPPSETLNNLSKTTKYKDLNFKVTEEFHRYYAMIAFKHNMKKIDVMRKSLELFVETYGEGENL